MPFEWYFSTGGRGTVAANIRCHRGPMISFESRMAAPFVTMAHLEKLRVRTLSKVVSVAIPSVQTREVVLRTLNSNLGPIFVDLYNQYEDLKAYICEKRNSVKIYEDLAELDREYKRGSLSLTDYGIQEQTRDLIYEAILSENVIFRVAARCALIVAGTAIEIERGT